MSISEKNNNLVTSNGSQHATTEAKIQSENDIVCFVAIGLLADFSAQRNLTPGSDTGGVWVGIFDNCAKFGDAQSKIPTIRRVL